MNEPTVKPGWARARMAALGVTVVAGGATCNVISGADSIELTGEPTSSAGSSSSSSSGGANGDPGTCPGERVSVGLGLAVLVIPGDTTGASDKIRGSKGSYPSCVNCDCMMSNAYAGPDQVYAVTPSASGTLTVQLDATYSSWQLNVRTKCSGNTTSDEVACAWGNNPGSSVTNPIVLSFPVIEGTTYYVVANSWDGISVGPFTLGLRLE